MFLPTEVKPKQRYLKPQGEISGLPKQCNDIYMENNVMIFTWRQDLRPIFKDQQNYLTSPTPPSTSGGVGQLMLNRQKQLKLLAKVRHHHSMFVG